LQEQSNRGVSLEQLDVAKLCLEVEVTDAPCPPEPTPTVTSWQNGMTRSLWLHTGSNIRHCALCTRPRDVFAAKLEMGGVLEVGDMGLVPLSRNPVCCQSTIIERTIFTQPMQPPYYQLYERYGSLGSGRVYKGSTSGREEDQNAGNRRCSQQTPRERGRQSRSTQLLRGHAGVVTNLNVHVNEGIILATIHK